MRAIQVLLLSTLFACVVEMQRTGDDGDGNEGVQTGSGSGSGTGSGSGSGSATEVSPLADVQCAGMPDTGPAGSWRHLTSRYIVELGAAHHRGIDLIASADDATQTIAGKITYGPTDKDLEDEDVEVYACLQGTWQYVATSRTNGDGRIALALTGAQRLPVGMRDLYLSVVGDRTGARFIGFVAPSDTRIVVSDVDGTLTAYENAYPESLVLGGDVAPHPGAPAALAAAAAKGYSIVYITARGDRFTQDTRDWFAAKSFPRGPVRMPSAIITMPGEETVEFKTEALAQLAAFELAAGIGNRASDILAYTSAGLAPERIFIKLAEFEAEYATLLMEGSATGFTTYDDLRTEYIATF
jgi:phosphatidate phosphatase PAH1